MVGGGNTELFATDYMGSLYIEPTDEDFEYIKEACIKALKEQGFESVEDYIGGNDDE
jgi:hypothetical protein